MQPSTSFENKAPRLVSHTHYCVMGDVTVADGAAIAPGVVLQASSGSRIVIASGACLAGGVCIQSRQGVLTIGPGANLGANVLVVGKGDVGENACISAGSTLIDPQVPPEQIVPPNALVAIAVSQPPNGPLSNTFSPMSASNGTAASNGAAMDSFTAGNSTSGGSTSGGFMSGGFTSGGFTSGGFTSGGFTSGSYASDSAGSPQPYSAQLSPPLTPQPVAEKVVNSFVEPPPVGPKPIQIPDLSDQSGQYVDPSVQNNVLQLNNGYGSNGDATAVNSSALSTTKNHRVYGKDQVSQLLSTLFPQRPT